MRREDRLQCSTLVCDYSFDSNAHTDSDQLAQTASDVGLLIASGTERVNDAISFAWASSYFVAGGLIRLGTIGQSYSISIWIQLISVNGDTIIHVSKYATILAVRIGVLHLSELMQVLFSGRILSFCKGFNSS